MYILRTWSSQILWPLGHRKPRSAVACTSQVFAKTTPKASSGFSNVKRALTAGYAVNKILRLAREMVTDGKETLRTSYLCVGTDIIAGRWHAREPSCSVEELSVECTSMFLRPRSRLYATKSGCGKILRVCWTVDNMRKRHSINGCVTVRTGAARQDGWWLLPSVDRFQKTNEDNHVGRRIQPSLWISRRSHHRQSKVDVGGETGCKR